MNGSSLPYHLRTNKAIERQIFFDLLSRLHLPVKIQNYKYISLGGPMLEDHQSLHNQLGLTNLESIERDDSAFSRQIFNKPFSCINCVNSSISDYILNFDEQEPTICWLDYVDTKWSSQFNDCHELIKKLKAYDIFKVTFNANPDSLSGDNPKEKLDYFIDRSSCNHISENLIENDITTMDRFALTISSTFNTIVDDALDSASELKLFPILQFRYIDNRHHMLTITGVVLPREDESLFEKLVADSELIEWPHISNNWNDIHCINVPDLTHKEKSIINQMLPEKSLEQISEALPFKLDKNSKRSNAAIENYIRYYRYIPNFQKMAM